MRSLLRQIDPLTGRLRNIILIGAIGCAMLASSRADAQCLPAPAWAVGPSGPTEDLHPRFIWAEVPGPVTYTLYILTVDGEETVRRMTGLGATSYIPGKSLPTDRGWLRWKVKAEGACGPGAYIDGDHFLPIGPGLSYPPTEAPDLIEPEGNIANPAP